MRDDADFHAGTIAAGKMSGTDTPRRALGSATDSRKFSQD